MSTVLKDATNGYIDETEFGVSEITENDTAIRAQGVYTESFAVPNPTGSIIAKYGNNYDPLTLGIGKQEISFPLNYLLQDGRELYYGWGKNSTVDKTAVVNPSGSTVITEYTFTVVTGTYVVGDTLTFTEAGNVTVTSTVVKVTVGATDTVTLIDAWTEVFTVAAEITGGYRHHITAMLKADGVRPQSRTFRVKTNGLTGERLIDLTGTLTQSMNINVNSDTSIGVSVSEGLIGTGVNPDATFTADAPIYRSGLGDTDQFILHSFMIDDTEVATYFKKLDISMTNSYITSHPNTSTIPNDYFLNTKNYELTFEMFPQDITFLIADYLLDKTVDKDIVIVLQRTVSTVVQTITFVFDTLETPFYEVSGKMQHPLEETSNWVMKAQPKSIDVIAINTSATLLADT